MKVLVVEDEHRIANSIKKGLEQERLTVDVAYDGQGGYDLAFSGDYDLIILDRMLPGLDGLTVCKDLRANRIHTPILMLTAKSETTDKVTGLNSGADDYLTKPFSFEELLARVRALGRRPRQSVETKLIVGDLEISPLDFEVSRNQTKILLTSKEFSLLEYLARNKDKIRTKDQIINQVWDYDSNILPNTIEVYIKNLRNKIDSPFKNSPPLIHTIRGFGYKVSETP